MPEWFFVKFTVRVKLHKVSDHRVTQILQECVASNVAKPRGYLVMRSVVLSRKSLFGEQTPEVNKGIFEIEEAKVVEVNVLC